MKSIQLVFGSMICNSYPIFFQLETCIDSSTSSANSKNIDNIPCTKSFVLNEKYSNTNPTKIGSTSSTDNIECSIQLADEESSPVSHENHLKDSLHDHTYAQPPHSRGGNLDESNLKKKKYYMADLEEFLRNFEKEQTKKEMPEEKENDCFSDIVDLSGSSEEDKTERIQSMMQWNLEETKKFQSLGSEQETEKTIGKKDLFTILSDEDQLQIATGDLRKHLEQFFRSFDLKTESFKESRKFLEPLTYSTDRKKVFNKSKKSKDSVIDIIEKERRYRRKKQKSDMNRESTSITKHYDENGFCLRNDLKTETNSEQVETMTIDFLKVSSKFNSSIEFLTPVDSEEYICEQVWSDFEDVEIYEDFNIFINGILDSDDEDSHKPKIEADLENNVNVSPGEKEYIMSERDCEKPTREMSGYKMENLQEEKDIEISTSMENIEKEEEKHGIDIEIPYKYINCSEGLMDNSVPKSIVPAEKNCSSFTSTIDKLSKMLGNVHLSAAENFDNALSESFEMSSELYLPRITKSNDDEKKHVGIEATGTNYQHIISSYFHDAEFFFSGISEAEKHIQITKKSLENIDEHLSYLKEKAKQYLLSIENGSCDNPVKSDGIEVENSFDNLHEDEKMTFHSCPRLFETNESVFENIPSEEIYSNLQSTCLYHRDVPKVISKCANYQLFPSCIIECELGRVGSYDDFVYSLFRKIVKPETEIGTY